MLNDKVTTLQASFPDGGVPRNAVLSAVSLGPCVLVFGAVTGASSGSCKEVKKDCETGHDPTTSNGPSPTATLDEVDFRAEPLATIQTGIELLQQRGSADGDSGRIFDLVVHQTQHLSRMIDDLVDLPRISIGKLKLETAPVKVVAIVDEALASTRKVIASHGHHLLDIGSRSATTPSVLDEQSSRLSMSHPLPGA